MDRRGLDCLDGGGLQVATRAYFDNDAKWAQAIADALVARSIDPNVNRPRSSFPLPDIEGARSTTVATIVNQ